MDALNYPEFTFKDRVYRFQSDLTVAAMDVLSQVIHDSRQVIFAEFTKNIKSDAQLFEFTVKFADVWHEIHRAGKTSLFVAACVATDIKAIKALAFEFESLPDRIAEEIFSFFFNGGTLSNLIIPRFLQPQEAGDSSENPPSDEPSSPPATKPHRYRL